MEGTVHQKIVQDTGYWNGGPERNKGHIDNFRIRKNIKQACARRDGFPDTLHTDHKIFDNITILTEKIYGVRVFPWWKDVYNQKLGPQTFTIIPLQSVAEQVVVKISELPCHYTASQKFFAKCQKSRIPYLPMANKEEFSLYSSLLPTCLQGRSYNFQTLASLFNQKADGIKIFKKHPQVLQAHFKDASANATKRMNRDRIAEGLESLKQKQYEIAQNIDGIFILCSHGIRICSDCQRKKCDYQSNSQ